MRQPGKMNLLNTAGTLTILLALLISSCASSESTEKKTMDSLRLSIDAFNGAFKWEDYPEAVPFVPPDKKAQFWTDVDRFKGKIRLTEYELRDVTLSDRNLRATAIVHFQYWRPESPVLQGATVTQKWYFLEKEKKWMVSDTGFGAITGGKGGL